MNGWIVRVLGSGAVATGAFVAPACAEDARGGLLNDRFSVSLGTFVVGTSTKIRVDGSTQVPGTEVNLERELGFRDANRLRFDATWRFAPRHKVRALYFNVSRDRTASLDRDITVGDTTYPVSGQVQSSSSFKVAELAYEYVFVRRADYEVTASLGVHGLKVDFGLSGQATVNGQSGQFRTERAATSLPMPVFGLRGLWEFRPSWYLDGQAQYFAVKFDNLDGSLSDLRLGVTRMFGDHWGVGAGWNRFDVDVGLTKNAFRGNLNWEYSGAQVYLTGSF